MLGDCYFLGALACLAETPVRVSKMIQPAGFGRYQVQLYKQGLPRTVFVDDRFPCRADGQIAFGQSTSMCAQHSTLA